jgi:urease subunit beta
MIPGELIVAETGPIAANAGLETRHIEVANSGDRPIQVGSHYHFYETNEALRFRSPGQPAVFRLNIPAGTAVRFEPGDTRRVELVALAGLRKVFGFSRAKSTATYESPTHAASVRGDVWPTVGDSFRLADTELFMKSNGTIAENGGYGNEGQIRGRQGDSRRDGRNPPRRWIPRRSTSS